MPRFRVRDPQVLRERLDTSQRVVPHTIRSLAKQVNVSHALIGFLLTGERDTVDADLAKRIAKELKVPLRDLFVRENSPSGYGRKRQGGERP